MGVEVRASSVEGGRCSEGCGDVVRGRLRGSRGVGKNKVVQGNVVPEGFGERKRSGGVGNGNGGDGGGVYGAVGTKGLVKVLRAGEWK